jgi:hypothetical protein
MLYDQAAQATYRYREFEIELTKPDDDPARPYRTIAADPDGRQMEGTFVNPIDPSQVASAVASIPAASKAIQRALPDESLDPVKDMGARLFDALFEGAIGRAFAAAMESTGDGVRVRLVANDDQAAALPWEFLYDRGRGDFLVLSTRSPVVRRVGGPDRAAPKPLEPPIRILASVADVTGFWKVDDELELLSAAVESSGAGTLDVLKSATAADFARRLAQTQPHVVHVIGTGTEEGQRGSGYFRQQLAFMPDGAERPETASFARLVDAELLSGLFGGNQNLRVVVLNGCRTDMLAASVARDAPATIGHRGDVTDVAALAFTDGFYSALLNGLPLEGAVTSGRLAIDAKDPGGREWSAPVFYLQTADGSFLPDAAERSRTATPVELVKAVAPPERTDGDGADRELQSLASLLKIHESNLDALVAQQSGLGENAPSYLDDQIKTANEQIEQLRARIAAAGGSP